MSTNQLDQHYVSAKFTGNGVIEWVQFPIPEPGEGQLLIEVKANALCGQAFELFWQGNTGKVVIEQ